MTRALSIVLLVVTWAAITGSFNLPNLLLGAVIAGLVVLLLRRRPGSPRLQRKIFAILRLAGLFVFELLASALAVGRLVLLPNIRGHLQPGIIAFPLRVKSDAEITLLANLITLTPGTLSVDVSEDRSKLYVHALMLKDRQALIDSIANGFEARIIEVFK